MAGPNLKGCWCWRGLGVPSKGAWWGVPTYISICWGGGRLCAGQGGQCPALPGKCFYEDRHPQAPRDSPAMEGDQPHWKP